MVQEEIGEKERTVVVGVLKRGRLMSERGNTVLAMFRTGKIER